jgi:hypothetical protein
MTWPPQKLTWQLQSGATEGVVFMIDPRLGELFVVEPHKVREKVWDGPV